MIGNTTLVNYGIQNDKSDYRAHVCVNAHTVYVFKTSNAQAIILSKVFKKVPVFTGNIKTAVGYIVPYQEIVGIAEVMIPDRWMEKIEFSEYETPTMKGNKAVTIVKGLLKKGMFPIVTLGKEIKDKDLQIAGVDIIVNVSLNIQVKCDYRGGGEKNYPQTTGNVFLQIAECNPYRST